MNRAQTQFLELLRAGLWGVAADPENFKPDSVDWKAVLRIAKEQTMLAVVADGIETLPKELWPPKEVMMKLAMMRLKIEQTHDIGFFGFVCIAKPIVGIGVRHAVDIIYKKEHFFVLKKSRQKIRRQSYLQFKNSDNLNHEE